jgi:hypothetical protein
MNELTTEMNKFSKMNRLTEKAVDLKRIQQTALGD